MSEATMPPISATYIAAFRGYLRITSTALDGEIQDLIDAARHDLILGGILPARAADESDALVKKAIASYVKAEFGLDNEDADKYRAAYRSIKIALGLANQYIQEEA